MAYSIDINCDMGESRGTKLIGDDRHVFPYITSCNIACGVHGGDPVHMEKTILGALEHAVQIGAHPSYPDTKHFGRKKMQIPAEELKAVIRYQVSALCGMASALGAAVTYVKPHGALYNNMAADADEARAFVQAVASLRRNLAIIGLAGSHVEGIAAEFELKFIPEAFADRRYLKDGRLMSRKSAGAIIDDPSQVAEQFHMLVVDKRVESSSGKQVEIAARTVCVHGDHPGVTTILKAIDEICKRNSIQKRAFVA
jgi:UPF0271 protein